MPGGTKKPLMPGSINSIAPPCVRLTLLQHNSADTALRLDYRDYSACLSRFFGIQPLPGETIATDGKVLRGSYEAISDDPTVDSHLAIILVTAYIVERGLILEP